MEYAICVSCSAESDLSQVDIFTTNSSERDTLVGSITLCARCIARMPVNLQAIVDATAQVRSTPIEVTIEYVTQLLGRFATEPTYETLTEGLNLAEIKTPNGNAWTANNLRAQLTSASFNKTTVFRSLHKLGFSNTVSTTPTAVAIEDVNTPLPFDMPGIKPGGDANAID